MQTIMIVEDEKVIRDAVVSELEKWNYEVVAVVDFSQVYTQFLSVNPQLVILDITLPFYNGYYWCQEIRKVSQVPIMFLSSHDQPMDIVMSINMGADDYMTKPFSPSELVARVKAHINRYDRLAGVSAVNRDIIEVRELKIDSSSRRVWSYGKERTLTAKEFDILRFLAEHPNKVYAKEDLFKEVWGLESMGDISTVTVHIKNIREKIELDSSKPQFIETIWGVGYRFRG